MNYTKSLIAYQWNSGNGDVVSFSEIIEDVNLHTRDNGKVYIGADSQLHADSCTFVTAICLHGGSKKTSRYYFKRETKKKYDCKNLRRRIDDEVSNAIDVFLYLTEKIPGIDVEVHIDIGSTERSRTRSFVDTITGWVKGMGATCKIKPDAWASASVADRHTK
jgi:predicted RNase H-related nuclease YkuK (DUF458 family)